MNNPSPVCGCVWVCHHVTDGLVLNRCWEASTNVIIELVVHVVVVGIEALHQDTVTIRNAALLDCSVGIDEERTWRTCQYIVNIEAA